MADMKPMTEAELLSYLQQCETQAATMAGNQLSIDQRDALDRYYGRAYGDEQDGRSKAMTHEVRELINWAMPSLMRVFESSDDLVTLDSGDDAAIPEQLADMMADGMNHVFAVDNDGYGNLYDFCFDGLTQKVGIMETRWAEPELMPPEVYEDVDVAKLQRLISEGYKILEASPCQDEGQEPQDQAGQPPDGPPMQPMASAPQMMPGVPLGLPIMPQAPQMPPQMMQPGMPGMPPMGPQMMPPQGQGPEQCFDVKVQRSSRGKIEIEAVPPEEMSWDRSARSFARAKYVRRIEAAYLSDIKACYPDQSDALDRAGEGDYQTGDAQLNWNARHQASFADRGGVGNPFSDRAKQVFRIHEFVRIDFDGDGIVELREVIRVGKVIVHNEVADHCQFHLWTPVRIPHTVAGLSLADDAIEVQGINTALTRRGLDSVAASLNTRFAFDATRTVEGTLDSLLDNRIGSPVPVNGPPSESLFPLVMQDVSAQALEWIGHFKSGLETKTGIGPSMNGVDPNALARNQSGVATNLAQMAASGRLELIARAMADGLRDVFQSVLRLLVQHQDEVRTIQRVGKPPLVLDPSMWVRDARVQIHVAIATSNRNSQLSHLGMIEGKQKEILLTLGPTNPLVNLTQYSNTLVSMVEAMGFRNTERFVNAVPEGSIPPQPPKEDPKVTAAKAAAQLAKELQDAEQVRLDEKQHADLARQQATATAELDLKRRQLIDELALEREMAMLGIQQQLEIERIRAAAGLSGGGAGHSNGISTSSIHVGGQPG